MNVAVITFHNVCNYGSQLQAYATQEKLKEYFNEVVFIDFNRADTYGIELLNTFTKGSILKIPAILPTLIYWKYLYRGFQKNHLNLSERKYFNERDFDNFEDCADVYFSGSDQIWNTDWNKGVLPPYYLSFVPDGKPKFAYASSFGKTLLSEDDIAQSKKYIERYDGISVREESGTTILREQYGYKRAIRILDPTLFMSAEFWRRLAPPRKIQGDYILIYNIKRVRGFDDYAIKIARKTGYKLYRLCNRFDQILRNGKSIVMPGIFDFITLIDCAKMVITDSFHATAFAMNLNTEPICICHGLYSGRISEFLELVHQPQRHAINFDDVNITDRHTNFSEVNEILERERKRTDVYLSEIIRKVSNQPRKNR